MDDRAETTPVAPDMDDDTLVREPHDWRRCRLCKQRIVRSSAGISFDGGHTHRFINPGGFAYRIALFDHAKGCRNDGDATDYFSWFAGYEWRAALCLRCNSHLGWSFECLGTPGDGEPSGFHALIVDRLE